MVRYDNQSRVEGFAQELIDDTINIMLTLRPPRQHRDTFHGLATYCDD
jgi:hypothetical protein